MKRLNVVLTVVAALIAHIILGASALPATTAFVDVNVVDVAKARIAPDQTVVITDDRIVQVAPARQVSLPKGARTIDGKGRFLMPGLADMHAHLRDSDDLILYLSNGVTTVRNLWGEPKTLKLREDVESGRIPGPRFTTAGDIVDGAPKIWPFAVELTDPAAADAFVANQKAAGYDFVKTYSRLKPEVFDAILAAGHKYGIEVSGHVPQDVSLFHAIEAGMRTSEHFLGVVGALTPDSAPANPDLATLDERARAVVIALGKSEIAPESLIDEKKFAKLAALAAKSDHWFDPTIDIMRNFTNHQYEGHPAGVRYLSPADRKIMEPGAVDAFVKQTKEMKDGEDRLYGLRLQVLVKLHHAGAKILAGTDNTFFAGWSLIQEVKALSVAGLGNAAALRTATIAPAEYLKRRGELGEVRAGALADLVLLGGNPLENLDALYTNEGVMSRGAWRTRAEFATLLDGVAARRASMPQQDYAKPGEK